MGDATSISWTDATWNPVRGCSRVSEGCRNCYAERVAARFSDPGQAYEGLADRERPGSKWSGVVRMVPEHLADPLRWKRPRRIFVNSMSDLFHEKLTNEEIAAVFGVMAAARTHTFQVLTKRAHRMREWFDWVAAQRTPLATIRESPRLICRARAGELLETVAGGFHPMLGTEPQPRQWPLPNVWLGVSVENQDAADERIPELLATPAAVRFLSCEPLLGDVSLTKWLCKAPHGAVPLQWCIAGCESGPGARPCSVSWLRSLRDQCASAGVPYFLKQAAAEIETCTQGCRQQVRYYAHGPTTSSASCGCTVEGAEDCATPPIAEGEGARRKGGGVIELPYLDGMQHAAFPEAV